MISTLPWLTWVCLLPGSLLLCHYTNYLSRQWEVSCLQGEEGDDFALPRGAHATFLFFFFFCRGPDKSLDEWGRGMTACKVHRFNFNELPWVTGSVMRARSSNMNIWVSWWENGVWTDSGFWFFPFGLGDRFASVKISPGEYSFCIRESWGGIFTRMRGWKGMKRKRKKPCKFLSEHLSDLEPTAFYEGRRSASTCPWFPFQWIKIN